jgi:hypothetical protein
MLRDEILKDEQFQEVTEARVDAKHRVTLGRLVDRQVSGFRVYRNAHGQIILDPLVAIPAHEAWLFQSKRAAGLVQRGLDDARRGRLSKAREDFSKYVKDPE